MLSVAWVACNVGPLTGRKDGKHEGILLLGDHVDFLVNLDGSGSPKGMGLVRHGVHHARSSSSSDTCPNSKAWRPMPIVPRYR